MEKFKVKLWEKVSICQEVVVVIEAKDQDDLLNQIHHQNPNIVDWIDVDQDLNTEQHLVWYRKPYEILENWIEKEVKHG